MALLQNGVYQRHTESGDPTTHSSLIRKTGARGGSRTHMRKNPRRILSPQRLPFRHPGSGTSNLTNRVPHRNSTAGGVGCAKTGAIFWLGATALFHQPDRSQTEVSQLSRDADSVFPPSELESASSPSWRSVCDNFCQLRDGKRHHRAIATHTTAHNSLKVR